MGQKASAPLSQAQVKKREVNDPRYQYLLTEPERLQGLETNAASKLQDLLESKNALVEVDLRRSGLRALPLPENAEARTKGLAVSSALLSFNRFQKFPAVLAHWTSTLATLDLSSNHLHGEPFAGLTLSFTALRTLKLSRNGLTAVVINPILECTPNLEHLDLSHNPLCQWPTLSASVTASLCLLDLRFCNIETLPKTPFQHLQILRLDGNRIREMPDELFSDVLQGVSLEGNPIPSLPNVSCSSLQVLNVGRLHLTTFPLILADSCAASLTVLEVKCSNFAEFPPAVLALKRLVKLSLTGATFTSVPADLDLPLLTHLIVRFNKLTEVPRCRVPLLQVLDVAGNTLTSLQILDENKMSVPWLQQFPCLTALSAASNSLASVADVYAADLLTLPVLQHLNLDNNPLISDAAIRRALEHSSSSVALQYLLSCSQLFSSAAGAAAVAPLSAGSFPASPCSVRDAILGCVVGCAMGDAVGLTTEFMQRIQAFIHYHAALPLWSEACAYPSVGKNELENALMDLSQGGEWLEDAHRGRWVRGDFTDDTDQLLLILDNICDGNGKVNAGAFAQSIYRWAKEGFSELGDQAGMGIGSTVAAVLRHGDFLPPAVEEGKKSSSSYHPHKSARQVWETMNKSAAANGSVMRVAVLGVPNFWDPAVVGAQTREISAVTHMDPRTLASCFVVTHLVSAMLRTVEQQTKTEEVKFEGFTPAWTDTAVQSAVDYSIAQCSETKKGEFSKVALSAEYLTELKWHCAAERTLRELDLENTKQMGYTYKALGAAIWAFRQPDFMHALHLIALEAGDADTNGAVAGALLGTRLGLSHLPTQWMSQFPHRGWLLQRAEKLADVVLDGR